MKELALETIMRAYRSLGIDNEYVINACTGRSDLPMWLIKEFFEYSPAKAEQILYGSMALKFNVVRDWIGSGSPSKRLAAIGSLVGHGHEVPLDLLDFALKHAKIADIETKRAALEALVGAEFPSGRIRHWLDVPNEFYTLAALAVSIGKDAPMDLIEEGVKLCTYLRRDEAVHELAVEYLTRACVGQKVPYQYISSWLQRSNNHRENYLRMVALNACKGRSDVPQDIVDVVLKYPEVNLEKHYYDRLGAKPSMKELEILMGCRRRDVRNIEQFAEAIRIFESYLTKKQILWLLHDKHPDIVLAALDTCKSGVLNGKIKRLVSSLTAAGIRHHFYPEKEHEIRCKATEVCHCQKINLPLIRDFEPPALVYKKCAGNVILTVSIPGNAQVRGNPNDFECYADRALILRVTESFYGEEVGISTFDHQTTYRSGDFIFIKGFDLYFNSSSKDDNDGFQFFCTKEEAEACAVI